ncbi:DUF6924 domain-containing protein [Streptomyces sp. NRRL WC-3549]|uniref:DUF6924 domain-containing protein n=1 Tax=Streptomyces sp. NRRL WC-3549 TaxID=1463925 RepID=UPI003B63D651
MVPRGRHHVGVAVGVLREGHPARAQVVDAPAWSGARADEVLAAVDADEYPGVVSLADRETTQSPTRSLFSLCRPSRRTRGPRSELPLRQARSRSGGGRSPPSGRGEGRVPRQQGLGARRASELSKRHTAMVCSKKWSCGSAGGRGRDGVAGQACGIERPDVVDVSTGPRVPGILGYS